jgi:hypothetical protein
MSSSTGGIVRSRSRSSALRTLSYTTPSTSLSQSSSAATSVSSAHAVTTSPTISRARSSSASCNGSPKRKVSSRPTVSGAQRCKVSIVNLTNVSQCAQFKPPVLSLRNAVLFSDAYSKVVDDHLLHAPTLEQGKAFEMQIAECMRLLFTAAVVVFFSTEKKKKKKKKTLQLAYSSVAANQRD